MENTAHTIYSLSLSKGRWAYEDENIGLWWGKEPWELALQSGEQLMHSCKMSEKSRRQHSCNRSAENGFLSSTVHICLGTHSNHFTCAWIHKHKSCGWLEFSLCLLLCFVLCCALLFFCVPFPRQTETFFSSHALSLSYATEPITWLLCFLFPV